LVHVLHSKVIHLENKKEIRLKEALKETHFGEVSMMTSRLGSGEMHG
jgi:hypothetical protein